MSLLLDELVSVFSAEPEEEKMSERVYKQACMNCHRTKLVLKRDPGDSNVLLFGLTGKLLVPQLDLGKIVIKIVKQKQISYTMSLPVLRLLLYEHKTLLQNFPDFYEELSQEAARQYLEIVAKTGYGDTLQRFVNRSLKIQICRAIAEDNMTKALIILSNE